MRIDKAPSEISWEGNLYHGNLEGAAPVEGLSPDSLDKIAMGEVPDAGAFGPAWWTPPR